ncbi:hypothetical protein [Lederbergia citri]|uniref:Uncharacterized protein n=1 Tax=Lederbergia citri TaxID=2833580 RepID=A0A942TFR6_9BACI|nr:hypothetical protein [Lederbergia citri]MBS4195344.1 hypothetical protein [Lederbergia citri]
MTNMADNKSREVGSLHVKVNVDVSEALTGLKALTREAREATKALRELEAAQKRSGSSVIVSPLTVGEPTLKVGSGYGVSSSTGVISQSKSYCESTQSITDDIRRCYE